MNEKYAFFIWGSYGLTLAALLWNWLRPKVEREELRRRLAEPDDYEA